MSDQELTVFQGRRCVRVRRQAGSPPPPGNGTSATTPLATTAPQAPPAPPAPANPPPPAATNPAGGPKPDEPAKTTTSFSLKAAISPPPPPPPQADQPAKKGTTTTNANPVNTAPAPAPPPAAPSTPTSSTLTDIAPPAKTTPLKPAVIPPAVTSAAAGTTDVVAAPAPVPTANQPRPADPAPPANNPPTAKNPPASIQPGNSAKAPEQQPNQPGAAATPPAAQAEGSPPPASQGSSEGTPAPAPVADQPSENQPAAGQPAGEQAPAQQPTAAVPAARATPLGGTGPQGTGRGNPFTAVPTTATSVFVSTAKDGLPTSVTSTFVLTPTAAIGGKTGDLSGSGNAGAGLPEGGPVNGRKMDAGRVVGTIAGVVSSLILASVLFFCLRKARKRRNRGSGSPLLVERMRGGYKTAMAEKIASAFPKRSTPQQEPTIPRIPTPHLEGGIRDRDDSSSNYSSPSRNRASSVPVVAFRERALNILKRTRRSRSPEFVVNRPPRNSAEQGVSAGPPRITTPTAHRRSASSVSSILNSWSATSEENNPFRDPDPNSRLHIVNPDLSRSNTAKTVLQKLPNTFIGSSLSPGIKSPERPGPARSPGIMAAAAAIPPIVAIPRKPVHKRSLSQNRIVNPFLDPEPAPGPSHTVASQPKTMAEALHVAPLAFKSPTYPTGRPLQHQPSQSSVDSGFVSAKSPFEDQEEDAPGFRGDNDLLKKWNLSTVFSGGGSSVNTSKTRSTVSTVHDGPRMSKASLKSGSDQAGSSTGQPSRPVTSQYPSYLLDPDSSRVSDPFDLDRPELLGLMRSHWTIASRETSLSRSGSNRSRNS